MCNRYYQSVIYLNSRQPRNISKSDISADAFSWVFAIFLATFLRYEFDLTQIQFLPVALLGLFSGILHVLIGGIAGLYQNRYRSGSFDQAVALIAVTAAITIPLAALTIVFGAFLEVPRSSSIIASPIFLFLTLTFRFWTRFPLRSARKNTGKSVPTLIYGAGEMAEYVIPKLLSETHPSHSPVGLIDDDPAKANRWISGVRMLGTFEDFQQVVASTEAKAVIVAIPGSESSLLQRVRDVVEPLGVKVLFLPSFLELLSRKDEKFELREVGIEDLIGRRAVKVSSDSISEYLSGASVLVTGAGGSIGTELCRQVSLYNPSRLLFLDRDETGLQLSQFAVGHTGLLDSPDIVLADIRDKGNLEQLFVDLNPDVVFHAAALKHLPALEKFPAEAWKTNVIGTLNVLEASRKSGVSTFVNISTDKAADPISALGRSKSIAEGLTSWFATSYSGSYKSVRFGNVLGSRGSLIPTLNSLIERNQPVTITHPDVSRYFMTTSEACQLVLQAGASRDNGAVLILDMGEPVRIVDLARKMIAMSGKALEIVFTGLRPGEKLHENLNSPLEQLEDTDHPLIWKVSPNPISPLQIRNYKRYF